MNDLKRIKNQMANWLDRYFPEYKRGYASWDSESFLYVLDKYKLPIKMSELNAMEVYSEVRKKISKGVGQKKIENLIKTSKESIGMTQAVAWQRRNWIIY